MASLSAGTSGHLRGVGLAKKDVDPVTNLNDLFHRALTHLVYMPYAYAVDRFKWDAFSSAVREGDLNCHWVKLRLDVQGEGEKATSLLHRVRHHLVDYFDCEIVKYSVILPS